MKSEAELCLLKSDICLPQRKQCRLQRSHGTAMSMRLRMSKFHEGERKEFGVFHLGTFISRPLGMFSMYIHKRWAGKGGGKKVIERDPAGFLKLLFGDLNFSCFPMSLVCPCGTKQTVQYVSLSELKQKVGATQTRRDRNGLSLTRNQKNVWKENKFTFFFRTKAVSY